MKTKFFNLGDFRSQSPNFLRGKCVVLNWFSCLKSRPEKECYQKQDCMVVSEHGTIMWACINVQPDQSER